MFHVSSTKGRHVEQARQDTPMARLPERNNGRPHTLQEVSTLTQRQLRTGRTGKEEALMQRTMAIAHLQHRPAVGHGQHNPGSRTATFVSDWTGLKRGDRIWIRREGQTIASGDVDHRTYDGEIVWILSHDTSERKMFHRIDGDEIWSPKEGDC
jgi:hypothetical protein